MEDLIEKVMKFGVDFGTRAAVKSVLSKLNADVDRADEVYVKIKNRLNMRAFTRVPYKDRVIFLPHCMRSSEKCQAEFGSDGYDCVHCGCCNISEIVIEAKRLGYRVHVVPGGSMVFKIWNRNPPKAALGVACYFELSEALEKIGHMGVPAVGVPLDRDGCKDTLVNVNEVLRVMRK
ncbi:MAG TPA: DUF116 domain-containing protein [Euryarchaeota archaeon]|nr:DUF116 domain-containing protein [Euryarchaeota archaeon]